LPDFSGIQCSMPFTSFYRAKEHHEPIAQEHEPGLLWSRCSSSEKHPPMGAPKIAPFPSIRPYSLLLIAGLWPDPHDPNKDFGLRRQPGPPHRPAALRLAKLAALLLSDRRSWWSHRRAARTRRRSFWCAPGCAFATNIPRVVLLHCSAFNFRGALETARRKARRRRRISCARGLE
jgi:hypothetical protein